MPSTYAQYNPKRFRNVSAAVWQKTYTYLNIWMEDDSGVWESWSVKMDRDFTELLFFGQLQLSLNFKNVWFSILLIDYNVFSNCRTQPGVINANLVDTDF